MLNKFLHQIKRLLYFIRHGHDSYGRPGFTQLYFKGKPIILRDYVPLGEVWLANKNGKIVKKFRVF